MITFDQLAQVSALSSWPLNSCKVKSQNKQLVTLCFEQGDITKCKLLQFHSLNEATECISNLEFIQKKQMQLKKVKEATDQENDGYWSSFWKDLKSQLLCCCAQPTDSVRVSFHSCAL